MTFYYALKLFVNIEKMYRIFEEETSNFSNQQIVTKKFTKELFKLFEKNCGSFFNLFSKIKIY